MIDTYKFDILSLLTGTTVFSITSRYRVPTLSNLD